MIERLAAAAGQSGQWGVRWDAHCLPSWGVENLSALLPGRAPILVIAGLSAGDYQSLASKPMEAIALKNKFKLLPKRFA